MPSVSKKQHNFMAAVANNPKFAKKAGVSKSIGEEFMKADKSKKVAKKAVGMHEKQLHAGKKSNLTKLAKGGGIEVRGKTKGTMIKMKNGGGC
jgi:hypothetical protein